MRRRLLMATVAVLATASGSIAATENFSIDPVHSQVGFAIRHFFSKVPGKFTKYTGKIAGDKDNLAAAKVTVEIESSSIDTGVADRDKHLRSADFFDVEIFPTIKFESKSVKAVSATHIVLTGDLTIRGVTKSVDLDTELLGAGPDSWGGYRAGFEGRTTINRKDFGVNWNKILDTGGAVLGDDVEISLNIEAVRDKQ